MKNRKMLAVWIGVIVILVLVGGGILYKNGDLFQGRLKSGTTTIKSTDCPTLQKQCKNGNTTACYEVKKVCAPSTSATAEITPVGPSNLVLTPSSNKIRLRWTDNSDNERGFRVQRSMYPGRAFENIKALTLNVTSFVDDTVSAGYTYYYRVYSVYGPRLSNTYADGNATIFAQAPYNLRADAVNSTSINLSWDVPSPDTIYSYDVEIINLSTGRPRSATILGATSSGTVGALSRNTTYTFRVMSYSRSDAYPGISAASAYSEPLTVTTLP